MENETLQMLGRFKFALRRQSGDVVDVQRLVGEPAYARQILDAAEACDDEELVMMAVRLRDKLGLLKAAAAKPAPKPASIAANKYKFGARS